MSAVLAVCFHSVSIYAFHIVSCYRYVLDVFNNILVLQQSFTIFVLAVCIRQYVLNLLEVVRVVVAWHLVFT